MPHLSRHQQILHVHLVINTYLFVLVLLLILPLLLLPLLLLTQHLQLILQAFHIQDRLLGVLLGIDFSFFFFELWKQFV